MNDAEGLSRSGGLQTAELKTMAVCKSPLLEASRLLPVSIVAGPSANALLQDIVHGEPKRRFGLLVSSNVDAQLTGNKLMVEQLAEANGGHDPERIKAQIAAIAEKALVDHLII